MKIRTIAITLLGAGLMSFVHSAEQPPVKRVALVFDDGPIPENAGPLLAVLAKENVHVTFSLVGENVDKNPAMAKTIADAGHEIANHSQSHAHPRDLDDAALDREVADAQQKITTAIGVAPRWYWPPFLELDDRVRAAASRAKLTVYSLGRVVASMDYDTNVGAAEILRRATTDITDGTVILNHEWRAETREQLPAILAELRKQNCVFLTFSELADSLADSDPAHTTSTAAPTTPTAPAQPAIPQGGEALVSNDLSQFHPSSGDGNGDAIKLSYVDAKGSSFTRAVRVETTRDLSPAWAVEVRTPLTRPVQKGDTGFLRFYARTIASADETGAGQVRVVVQRAGPDYQKSLENTVVMRTEWQEFLLPFAFSDGYAPKDVELSFGFGFKRETVEIGGIELLSFGRKVAVAALPRTRFTYVGREPDAAWRRDALKRIEQIRKSTFQIEARTADGTPASGATIRIEQKRSAFQFGTALDFARLVQDTPENKIYREKAQQLFNAASPENDLKWGAWDGEWGANYNKEQSLRALRWLHENGFHVRGHVLVWPGWTNLPESIRKLKGTKKQSEIPALVLKHIADITGATREFVQEWDVVNEPFDNHDLMALFGTDIMVNWFKAAEAGAAPGAPLYLNDYANHDLIADKPHCADFFKVATFLRSKGAPLGGLGLQGHISALPTPPENVLAALDAYSEFKLPVRITEFDIDTDDEELQADYTRDFLIAAYSHPTVVGVQHWGFWAKAHWRPRSALFRADWSAKPAAQAYEALVLKQWRTNVSGKFPASGKVNGRGFHGDYVAIVELDGKRVEQTFTLRPEETKTVVAITLP